MVMKVQIIGSGCRKCALLAAHTSAVIDLLDLDCRIEIIADWDQFRSCGVVIPPGLIIDGTTWSAGRALTPEQLTNLFEYLTTRE